MGRVEDLSGALDLAIAVQGERGDHGQPDRLWTARQGSDEAWGCRRGRHCETTLIGINARNGKLGWGAGPKRGRGHDTSLSEV